MDTQTALGNVLIVDDSQAMLQVMVALLEQSPYVLGSIQTAGDGKQALRSIEDDPSHFQILFVDLHMPDMDGMELIRLAVQKGFVGAIVIFSEMDAKILDLAYEVASQHKARVIGSIHKPVTQQKVSAALAKILHFREKLSEADSLISPEDFQLALDNHYIKPYYQPKISAASSIVKGVEVLARIDIPGNPDAILPVRFLRVAEKFHLLDVMTFQLLSHVIKDYPQLKKLFGDDLLIAINLSSSQLIDFSFPKKLAQFISNRGILPFTFVLELTETQPLDTTAQLENINRLRMLGFGISLDDYGVGFTNIKQLRALPFSEIKLDRTLISGIHNDRFSQAIVASIMSVAETQKMHVVAEGLENYEELDFIQRNYPKLLLQGYLVTRPKPLASLEQWYRGWNKVFRTNGDTQQH